VAVFSILWVAARGLVPLCTVARAEIERLTHLRVEPHASYASCGVVV